MCVCVLVRESTCLRVYILHVRGDDSEARARDLSKFRFLGTQLRETRVLKYILRTETQTQLRKGKGHPCTGTEALYRSYGP